MLMAVAFTGLTGDSGTDYAPTGAAERLWCLRLFRGVLPLVARVVLCLRA